MFWSLLFNIVLIVLVVHICFSAFKYVKVSLFHHFLIPVYSLVMFFLTMKWTGQDLTVLPFLILAAIGLGFLETAALRFRKLPSKKKAGHWRYQMYRGWPYVIGWISVIVLGFILSDLISHSGLYHLFVDKVFETIWEEINPLSFFTQSHPWYVWCLSAVSSLTFAWRGTSMLKKQEQEGTIPVVD